MVSRDMTKPTKWMCAQRRLRSAWASAQSDQSLLSAWRKLGSLATHWAHSEDSDQTRRMPRLIRVFAGRTATLLVLSCRGSWSSVRTVAPFSSCRRWFVCFLQAQQQQNAVFDGASQSAVVVGVCFLSECVGDQLKHLTSPTVLESRVFQRTFFLQPDPTFRQ